MRQLYDSGEDPGIEANVAKMLAADASWRSLKLPANPWRLRLPRNMTSSAARETRFHQVAPISTNLLSAIPPNGPRSAEVPLNRWRIVKCNLTMDDSPALWSLRKVA